jgi:hypothetical protein
MRRKFLPFVALFSAIFLFASCLGGDDEDTSYYEDTAMTAFSIGTLKEYLHTTSSTGTDSTYKTTLDCSDYAFYIDQANREIYNPDSLPLGVVNSRVLCTASSKNSGTIVVNVKTADKSKDSLVYYSSTDSLDFSDPLEFRVYNYAGTAYRSYKVHVNVHKEYADSFKWNEMTSNTALAALKAMKAVSVNSKMFVFGNTGTQTVAYYTDITDGNTWTKADATFGTDAYKNVCVKDGYIYILDGGSIKKSVNADAWSAVATTDIQRLLGASTAKLYAMNANNALVSSTDEGTTWTAESLDDNTSLLPTQDLNFYSTPLSTNSNTNRLWLIGNRSVASYPSDSTSVVWGKIEENTSGSENQAWAYYDISSDNHYKAPRLNNLEVAGYNNGMIAFGSTAMGASKLGTFANFYTSRDGGITWHPDTAIVVPSNLICSTVSFAIASDANNHLWVVCGNSGQVWKGRLNKLGWKKEDTIFTE